MDNINTWTGLPVEESIRMTEDRDKWRKYVTYMLTLGSRTAKNRRKQNRMSDDAVAHSQPYWQLTFLTFKIQDGGRPFL